MNLFLEDMYLCSGKVLKEGVNSRTSLLGKTVKRVKENTNPSRHTSPDVCKDLFPFKTVSNGICGTL